MAPLLIGDVARRADVTAPTIRYYESLGLLTAPVRSSSGYRRYSYAHIEELLFIKKAQALGFSLEEVAEIMKLTRSGESPCVHVKSLGLQHLAAVEKRVEQLQRFAQLLRAELAIWQEQEESGSCKGLCELIAGADLEKVTREGPETRDKERKPARLANKKRRA